MFYRLYQDSLQLFRLAYHFRITVIPEYSAIILIK